jgi:hypothetical protein
MVMVKPFGIYTLANNAVYDQLIALLNSIELNVGTNIPVCIIPFDDRLSLIDRVVESRPNVTLFNNKDSLQRWEDFFEVVWAKHPQALKKRPGKPAWTLGHHRKYAAFDGEFDKFVFYDADSLAMKSLDKVAEKLDKYDFVFDDWEHKKPSQVTALNLDLIENSTLLAKKDIRSKLHCSSFFGSRCGLFNEAELSRLRSLLTTDQEISWVRRWWDDAFLFSYLTLRLGRPIFNFTLSTDPQDRTGNCADSDPFIEVGGVLYNQQGRKPIHRLHYMNYSSENFRRLAQGEDVDIAYKDVFLHYRFLQEPEKKPYTLRPPSLLTRNIRFLKKAFKKAKELISAQG